MTSFVLYVTISTALYYLVSRAKITEPIWRRFPSWLEYWTLCAACSGTLYAAGAAAVLGRRYDLVLLGFPGDHPLTPLIAAAIGMVFTPIVAHHQILGWMNLMETDGDEEGQE